MTPDLGGASNHQRRCKPDGDEAGEGESEPPKVREESEDIRACHRNAMARIPVSSRNQSTIRAGRWRPRGFIAWPLAVATTLICVITFCVLKKSEIKCAGGRWLAGGVRNESHYISNNLYHPAKARGRQPAAHPLPRLRPRAQPKDGRIASAKSRMKAS